LHQQKCNPQNYQFFTNKFCKNMQHFPNAPSGQKSMSMWTKPETPEQRAYFSTHAPKRRVYGLIQTLLQAGHTALALAAWTALFSSSLVKLGVPPFYIMCIAGLILVVLHVLFRVTWETFWYDKLDSDTRTDSSPFLPIGIMIVLLITEKKGATEFLTKQVDPVVEKTTVSLDSSHQAAIAALKMDYKEEVTRIEQSYAKAEETATKSVDASIGAWQRKQIISDNDRNWVNSNIATLNTNRSKKVEQANVGKSDALAKALADYNTAKGNIEGRHGQQIALVDGHNKKERDRYEAELGEVDGYAWLISLFFLLAIGALGYARVRINVMSGILPVRNYTVLDQHGSFIERIQTAIGDAMNRRGLQVAVWLHRMLSPEKPLQSFDGTVVATPGDYNSHGVQSADANTTDRGIIKAKQLEATTAARDTVDTMLKAEPVLISDLVSAPVRRSEPAMPTPPPAPPAPKSNPLGSKSTGNVQVDELITDAYHIFQAVLTTTDTELDYHLDRINKVKNRLNDLGWTYTTAGNKIRFEPLPAPPPPPAPIDLYEAASVPQDATASHCDTVPLTVTQPKGASEQDAIDGWFKSLLTAIQREPSNLNNPSANKDSVVRRIYDRCGEMRDGLRTGRIPNKTLRAKAGEYLHNTVAPALRSNGYLTNGVDEVVEQLVKIDTGGEAGKA
jgi:hypothetical protein